VGDVVGPDQDHREVRLDRQGPVDLRAEVGGDRADLAERPQVDAAVALVGHAAGHQRARGLLDPVDAVPAGAGVAEEGDLDGGTGLAAAVPAGRVGHGIGQRLADRLARDLGLGGQHAVETGPEQGQPTSPESRGGGELARGAGFPHVSDPTKCHPSV
jgi:GNAT superfamily N-acetyltransferase